MIKVFFLVALMFNSVGDVVQTQTAGAFKTFHECQTKKFAIIEEPPKGLPENVGLSCVEVQIKVQNVQQ
jgi:hypothetical protein